MHQVFARYTRLRRRLAETPTALRPARISRSPSPTPPLKAAGELDAYMRAYYGVPAEVMARAQACHAGTLESAAEWFAAYRAAGAHHLVVRLARPSLTDYNDTVNQLLRAAAGLR